MRNMKDSGIEWIGEIPEDWKVCKLKNVTETYTGNSIKDDKKELYGDKNNAFPYIATKDININTSSANYDNGMYTKIDDYSFKIAPKNSTLLCIEGGSAGKKIAYLKQSVSFVNKLCCFKPCKINSKYQFYYIQSPSFTSEFNISVSGLVSGVSMGKLKEFSILSPPLEEQEMIADYLDNKVKEIDNIISKTKETIEEYKKYKQSVITEAVTKGLNPNVEMKDSGVEWIGEIPNHWALVKVKQIFDMGRGRVISKLELDDDGKYPVYSSQTKNNGCLGYIKSFDFDVDQLTWTTDGANAGTIFLRKGKYNCTNVCGTLCPKQNYYNLNYLKYDLGYIAFFYKRPDTNGFKIMNNEMAEIKILYPTLEEQKLIANYLDSKIFKIDKLICKKEQLITQLEEYKKSLIYEYVTGKKEVSNK